MTQTFAPTQNSGWSYGFFNVLLNFIFVKVLAGQKILEYHHRKHILKLICSVVCFFLGNSRASELCMLTFRNTLFHLHRRVPIRLWRWNRQSVLKRRHIKFRCSGITQKKAYNVQNTAKVFNLLYFVYGIMCLGSYLRFLQPAEGTVSVDRVCRRGFHAWNQQCGRVPLLRRKGLCSNRSGC
jgi:hypothetical protein